MAGEAEKTPDDAAKLDELDADDSRDIDAAAALGAEGVRLTSLRTLGLAWPCLDGDVEWPGLPVREGEVTVAKS